jgi:hypothetical protein
MQRSAAPTIDNLEAGAALHLQHCPGWWAAHGWPQLLAKQNPIKVIKPSAAGNSTTP